MNDLIAHLRKTRLDFTKQTLDETEVHANPLNQFENWFKDAVDSQVNTPDAMVVATCSKEGKPSARVLLLRNFDEHGFVFYTNYHSKKAANMNDSPYAALIFFWPELERQIRIEGSVQKHDDKESDKYFVLRPDGSKLGAWSSQQSAVVDNRAVLDEKFEEMKKHFSGGEIPRPPFWGGYNVKPTHFEFWQGRPNRMHDRISYSLMEDNTWKIERLSP